MKKVILAGNAITAEILYDYISNDPRYKIVAATVDKEYLEGSFQKVPTVPLEEITQAYPPADCVVIMAAGYDNLNQTRENLFQKILKLGYEIETYIHLDARVYTKQPIGIGSVILPNAILEPGVKLGSNAMIWCNTTLAHHSSVGDHSWVATGAVISGQATVGRNTFVGVNATIVNDICVNDHSIIGGGALITKNVDEGSVHLARSAEQLRYTSDEYVRHFGV